MNVLVFVLLIANFQMSEPLITENTFVNEQIGADRRLEILEVTASVLSSYKRSADFWDHMRAEIRQDDFLDFVKLFAGDAKLADDIRWTNEMIPYSDYALLVLDNLEETGLPFELENVTIDRIDIDETGFYIVDLRMDKRLYSGLSKTDKAVKLRSGRKATYEMRIDLPNYLLSDARIQYVKLKKPKSLFEYMAQPVILIKRQLSKN